MNTAKVPRESKFPAGWPREPDKSWSERHHYIREDDAEFSDMGRSERFPSGWWIFPGMLIAVLVLGAIAL